MAAVTQVRQPHSEGRAYYDKKLAEGKTHREAFLALKRQVSDAVFTRLRADAQRAQAQARDPGGQEGNDSAAQRGRITPQQPALRASHSRALATSLRPAPRPQP
jgi:hypothetical protein